MKGKNPARQAARWWEVLVPLLFVPLYAMGPYWGELYRVAAASGRTGSCNYMRWEPLVDLAKNIPAAELLAPALVVGWVLFAVWRRRGVFYTVLPVAAGTALCCGMWRWLGRLAPDWNARLRYVFGQFMAEYGTADLLLLALGLALCWIARHRPWAGRPAGWRALRAPAVLSLLAAVFYGLYPLVYRALTRYGQRLGYLQRVLVTANHLAWFLFILLLGWFVLQRGLHPLWLGAFYGGALALSSAVFRLLMLCNAALGRQLRAVQGLSGAFGAAALDPALQQAAAKAVPALLAVLCLLALDRGNRWLALLHGLGVLWCILAPIAWCWARINGALWALDLQAFYTRTLPALQILRPPLVLLFAAQCVQSTRQGTPIRPAHNSRPKPCTPAGGDGCNKGMEGKQEEGGEE